jgi:hypothetical protein
MPASSTLIRAMSTGKRVYLVGAAVAVGVALSGASAHAAVFAVENTDDSGTGSLRQAIHDANRNAGRDDIVFAIGTDPAATQVIAPATDLPAITRRVRIDGYTQPGADPAVDDTPAQLRIVIDAAGTNRGLELVANSSTIRGLVVQSPNFGEGVSVEGNDNLIEGNYIGTDVTGTVAVGRDVGIAVRGDSNVVGGSTPEARNLISGNTDGLEIEGDLNTVLGNYVGTDVTGGLALSNRDGVRISGGANVIGGQGDGDGNLVSGNSVDGILITPATGVGAGAPVGNRIEGNLIGTDSAGTTPLPNEGDGVEIRDASTNTIGGTATGAGNVISGNIGAGVRVATVYRDAADGNSIVANQIGTDALGTLELGNGANGVYIDDASDNRIGAGGDPIWSTAGFPNTIAFNDDNGVIITGGDGNQLEHNAIHDNGDPYDAYGLGINLGGTGGPTDNDAPINLDADDGPNRLQNFPVIQSASRTGDQTRIDWTLDSLAEATFRVEFYASDACDDSGYGEGQTFLYAQQVTTDAAGHVAGTLMTNRSGGPSLTMTATVVSAVPIWLSARTFEIEPESTSEFSPCAEV